ncbi:hypothetical protein FSP39_025041 [Pinctada imbricata]|uniref:Calmodulin-binding domain-containing protein n=1 Tax=Pinctada imbricata TaxID=66713 RepID=A0AA88XK76_PINIB|nr:hypothetical protein FSP39_025041 [Pinctada imbricata]
MEGPGIPLVKTENHYTRYVSTDNLIGRSTSMESNTKADEEKTHLGFRLRIRKELIGRRTRVVDASFLLSLIGIIANVFDTELKFSGSIGANSSVSVVLRIITSITTVLLVMSVILYNLIGIKLQLITAGLENWSLVINYSIIFKTVTEVIVCSFHPLPYGDVRIPVMVVHKDDEGNPEYLSQYIPANSILSVLMFCRLYILGRFLVVHSDLFRDTTVQSLGTLSKVRINAQFVFKALMTTRPGTCLTAILLSTLIISSWSIRVCEFYTEPADGNGNYLQALWLTSVTFLTLGYGDVVPHSICGRIIAIKTGLMGVGIMALCVAVLARKLEQTRSERYVHTFVQQIHMDKLHRHAAADVVKQSMIVWKLRRSGYSFHSSRILRHRRKLLDAIRRMNQSQFSKSQLRDCVIGTVEVAKGVAEINDVAYEIKEDQANIQQRLENLEKLMTNIHFQLYEMRESMREKEKSANLKKN